MKSKNTTATAIRAAIDIGSNSVRLAMSDGERRSHITKLANGIESTSRLSPSGITATVAALAEYAEICAEKGCEKIAVFATEAVRRAKDGLDFCKIVKDSTGLTVVIASPETEARLALYGAVKPQGRVTVADLGGGSMEVISSRDGVNPDLAKSLPLGVIVLKNKFQGDYRAAIDAAPTLLDGYGNIPDYPLVMSGGSACAIAAAIINLAVYDRAKINGVKISAKALDDNMPLLLHKNLALFRPVAANRADTIPYGAIIIQALVNRIGANEFYVSDSGNLEAALGGFEF